MMSINTFSSARASSSLRSRIMAPMFPSLCRPLIRDKSSLPLLGVGLGEDSCPKVLDRSRLLSGSGGVEPLTGSRTEKESSSAGGRTTEPARRHGRRTPSGPKAEQARLAWCSASSSHQSRPRVQCWAMRLASRQVVLSCRVDGLADFQRHQSSDQSGRPPVRGRLRSSIVPTSSPPRRHLRCRIA